MRDIAKTPEPLYYAVIFASERTEGDQGDAQMGAAMSERCVAENRLRIRGRKGEELL